MVKKILIPFFILAVAIFILSNNLKKQNNLVSGLKVNENSQTQIQQDTGDKPVESANENKTEENLKNTKVRFVPFIVQAPLGNWDDPVFQDGCEEASIAMAMGWVNGEEKISPQKALEEIKGIVKFENDTFGFNADTDLNDVQKIFADYYDYQKIAIKENISARDIITELDKGNIILVPAFGQALKNPNFTQPGPVAHMLVIKGYDSKTGEFVTNDPGTKRGEDYRYKKEVLFDAIWQYPRGKGPIEIPKNRDFKKGILVVGY